MFRALLLFPNETIEKAIMEPPLSVTLLAQNDAVKHEAVELAIRRDAVFTTAVGHSSKRTLAVWHVTSPDEVVEHMLGLVRGAQSEDPKEGSQGKL